MIAIELVKLIFTSSMAIKSLKTEPIRKASFLGFFSLLGTRLFFFYDEIGQHIVLAGQQQKG